jgi:putative transposase
MEYGNEISDELWKKIEPLLPTSEPKKISGRPRKDDRKIMSGIFYIFHTEINGNRYQEFYGAPSTVHDRFKEWQKAGLFDRMLKAGLFKL